MELNCGFLFLIVDQLSPAQFANSDRTYGVHILLILTVWLVSIISSAGNSVIEMRAVRNVISYLVFNIFVNIFQPTRIRSSWNRLRHSRLKMRTPSTAGTGIDFACKGETSAPAILLKQFRRSTHAPCILGTQPPSGGNQGAVTQCMAYHCHVR